LSVYNKSNGGSEPFIDTIIAHRFLTIALVLLSCFLASCSFSGEINQKEFTRFLTEMDTRRDYSVTHAASQVKLLAVALQHESATVRYNAAQDLKGMGEVSLPAVPQLIRALNDKNRRVAKMSYLALEAIPLETVSTNSQLEAEQFLMKELEKDSLTVSSQTNLLKILSRLPEVSNGRYEALRGSLTSGSSKVRRRAIRILSTTEEEIDERLLADLEDSSPRIRGAAAQVLGLRKYSKAVIPLRQQLSDPAGVARWGAAIALAQLKDTAKSENLIQQLKMAYESGYEREQCRRLLISLGEGGYLSALERQKIAEAGAKRRAHKATTKKKVRKAVAVVEKKLKERQKSKVKSSKNADLARKEIIRYRLVLRGNNGAKKQEAIFALKRLSPYFGSASTTLLSALSNSDPVIRAEAARALGEIKMTRAVDELAIRAMEDNDANVRKYSAGALRAIDSATARDAVRRLPKNLGKDAIPEDSDDVMPLIRCSELVALCRLALQELGDLGAALDANAGQCAWEIQAGC
jgi:HEAT repeat protein